MRSGQEPGSETAIYFFQVPSSEVDLLSTREGYYGFLEELLGKGFCEGRVAGWMGWARGFGYVSMVLCCSLSWLVGSWRGRAAEKDDGVGVRAPLKHTFPSVGLA